MEKFERIRIHSDHLHICDGKQRKVSGDDVLFARHFRPGTNFPNPDRHREFGHCSGRFHGTVGSSLDDE